MTIAQELKSNGHNVSVMSVNSGWVLTRMTAGKGDTNIEESVGGMIKVADELTLENTGQFRNWDGKVIPL